jgi:hypothetical protein
MIMAGTPPHLTHCTWAFICAVRVHQVPVSAPLADSSRKGPGPFTPLSLCSSSSDLLVGQRVFAIGEARGGVRRGGYLLSCANRDLAWQAGGKPRGIAGHKRSQECHVA